MIKKHSPNNVFSRALGLTSVVRQALADMRLVVFDVDLIKHLPLHFIFRPADEVPTFISLNLMNTVEKVWGMAETLRDLEAGPHVK